MPSYAHRIRFYSILLRIRPAQLGALFKKCIRIRRRYIQTLTGHTFWADPVSVFGFQLLREGIYEPQLTRILQIALGPSDVFVDVGAHEGYFGVIASALVSQGCVHCIEPQTRLQPIILENLRINSANRVVLHNVALSDEDSKTDLFLRPSTNTGGSSIFRHWKIGCAKEEVQGVTLDSFFRQNALKRIRLLKMDCEGAEYLVVIGGRNVLKQQAIDFIAVEYHPAICRVENCLSAHRELKSAGYILSELRGHYIYHLPGLERDLQPLGELHVNYDWHA